MSEQTFSEKLDLVLKQVIESGIATSEFHKQELELIRYEKILRTKQAILKLIKESVPDEISPEEALCKGLDSNEGAEGWDAYRTELLTKLGLEE